MEMNTGLGPNSQVLSVYNMLVLPSSRVRHGISILFLQIFLLPIPSPPFRYNFSHGVLPTPQSNVQSVFPYCDIPGVLLFGVTHALQALTCHFMC